MRASAVYRPEQELKGFEKVYLEAGTSAVVTFRLTQRDFSSFGELMGRSPQPVPHATEFDLDTPLDALRSRLPGRLLVGLLQLMLARESKRSGVSQDASMAMAFLEMPIRSLVLLGKGRFSFKQAAAVLNVLHRHPLQAVQRLLRFSRR